MKPGDEVLNRRTGEIVRLSQLMIEGAEGVHLAIVTRDSAPNVRFIAGVSKIPPETLDGKPLSGFQSDGPQRIKIDWPALIAAPSALVEAVQRVGKNENTPLH
ncbi:hypothetical protein KDA14_04745 [Candidatus Saccharibacteria bacterium]|nr:hypothetical protein [Candidatus Saccharibacteria bacterium]